MSNWICDKCGATYIDVSHQEPSVLKQEIEIRKLKQLLKDLIDEAEGALQAIQKDCESDDWSIFHYPEVQYFYILKDKIDEALK